MGLGCRRGWYAGEGAWKHAGVAGGVRVHMTTTPGCKGNNACSFFEGRRERWPPCLPLNGEESSFKDERVGGCVGYVGGGRVRELRAFARTLHSPPMDRVRFGRGDEGKGPNRG